MNPYAPPREAELDGVEATRSIPSASILLRLAARGLDVGLGSLVAAPLALLFSLSGELPLEQVVARTMFGGLALGPITSVILIGLRWMNDNPSLGKTLLDLQIVDAVSGEPLSFVRGVLARESVLLVMLCAGCCVPPLFVVLIGVMSWTGRRAPHDWMSESVVVRQGGR